LIHSSFNRRIHMAAAIVLLATLLMLFAFSAGSLPVVQKAGIDQDDSLYANNEEAPGFLPLDVPLTADTQRQIYLLCREACVPFEVEMSILGHESDFDPDAVSDTDDHGIAQINRCNFGWLQEELGPIDFYDPIQCVRAGLRILGPLWARYGPHKALMAYNHGESGAKRKWDRGQATSEYSTNVLAQAEAYGWSMEVNIMT